MGRRPGGERAAAGPRAPPPPPPPRPAGLRRPGRRGRPARSPAFEGEAPGGGGSRGGQLAGDEKKKLPIDGGQYIFF